MLMPFRKVGIETDCLGQMFDCIHVAFARSIRAAKIKMILVRVGIELHRSFKRVNSLIEVTLLNERGAQI
jgi:hypothetical protein